MTIEDPQSAPAQAEPPSPVLPTEDRFAVFRNSRFLRYWLARFFGAFATQIVAVSVGWQIYALTGSTFDLGMIGLSQFLPSLLLVLVTGTAADRYPRRWIMGLATGIEALAVGTLLLLTWHGLASPVPVFAILAVIGVARAFFGPAASSLVVNLVSREELPGAIAWNSSSWQVASILGPVAGGILYGVSPYVAYVTATLLFAVSTVLVLSIAAPAVRTSKEPASLETVVAGFRFIWRERIVLGAISLDLFAVLLGGAVALMPVFATDILAVGPWGLGLLRAAPGIGAILTVVWLTRHPIRDHAGLVMFLFVGLFGAFTVVFGLSRLPWLSILALGLMGAADMISVYVRETLLQLWTPDEVRGRVNAVNSIFVGASNELGEFRAGIMAAWIGTVPAVVLGGVATIGVALVWSRLFPGLRKARTLDGRH
ncbi:MFS transporter [Aureimonas endophytica]|uniref:MFS transporter n=1 Tax=Aureimonas endophytica TaxID=2027858 RepID=A0A916ZPY8_9HYPH|nr:MFS transporter [Aureimonas endophytica]GGE08337.1 MFS transporter [Aureimonas endophytica]